MHSIVRLYIKTAVAFLVVGLLLGGYLLARRELFGVTATSYEISAHTHVILVGMDCLDGGGERPSADRGAFSVLLHHVVSDSMYGKSDS